MILFPSVLMRFLSNFTSKLLPVSVSVISSIPLPSVCSNLIRMNRACACACHELLNMHFIKDLLLAYHILYALDPAG